MKRIEWIQESGASVQEVADLIADREWCCGCFEDSVCDGKHSDCVQAYLMDEMPEEIKAPAESEAQAGAQINTSNYIVARNSKDVKHAFTDTCRLISDAVVEVYKEYGVLDFKNDKPEVHMRESSFFDLFDSLEMRAEYLEQISKYEIMASVDDVLYFCLSDSDHGLPVEGES